MQTNSFCAAESAAAPWGSLLGRPAQCSGMPKPLSSLATGETRAEQSNAGRASAGQAGLQPSPSDAGRGRKARIGVMLFVSSSQAPAELWTLCFPSGVLCFPSGCCDKLISKQRRLLGPRVLQTPVSITGGLLGQLASGLLHP